MIRDIAFSIFNISEEVVYLSTFLESRFKFILFRLEYFSIIENQKTDLRFRYLT